MINLISGYLFVKVSKVIFILIIHATVWNVDTTNQKFDVINNTSEKELLHVKLVEVIEYLN